MFTSSLAFTSSLVQVLFIHRFLLSHLDWLAPNKAQTGLQYAPVVIDLSTMNLWTCCWSERAGSADELRWTHCWILLVYCGPWRMARMARMAPMIHRLGLHLQGLRHDGCLHDDLFATCIIMLSHADFMLHWTSICSLCTDMYGWYCGGSLLSPFSAQDEDA